MLPRELIWVTPSRMRIPHVFCILAIDLQDKSIQNSWKNFRKQERFSSKGRCHFYAPPPESGGVLCYTLRNFECPSVRPSVSAHHHSCIGNSSYSFRPILLKLYRCFKDGLKICILFFQNPEIIFYHFFPIFNLDIFRALILQICIWSMYLVSATPPTVFGESFWNFTGVLRMVWRYAYCFFRILKLFFITFFAFLT